MRAGISLFSQLSSSEVDRGIEALRADLSSGAWDELHRDLLELSELHLGYYVVVASPR